MSAVVVGTAVVLISLSVGCTGIGISHYHEKAVVVTAAPIATNAGKAVLHEGGNAFDAAVTVGFVLAVVHPEAGNIGGGGFALTRHGTSGAIEALDFREVAPGAATEGMYQDDSGEVIPGLSTFGVIAAGVPGTVAGLYELWDKHGSLPWEQLVGVATALADTGFVIDKYLAASLEKHREDLSEFPETAKLFFPDGRSFRQGDRFIQEDLAKTLYAIATDGADGFYKGEVAGKIETCMRKHGGLITRDDLEQYRPVWRVPIHFKFDSLDIYSMPPPSSGGICVGQILKLLEPYDFSGFSPTSTEYIHLFCETSRLAFADRSEHLGDPDFTVIPNSLLNETYLKRRRDLISKGQASSSQKIRPGTPPLLESDQTTHFSLCDSAGNMVAITYTLNTAYGCKLAVNGAGFLLNNEMDDFSIKPGFPNVYGLVGGEANKIESGKRMLSSMSPTLVLKDNQPFMVLGTPGGSKIITVVAQTIINFTRYGMNLTDAVAHPRFHHQWLPDKIYLEQSVFDINAIQGLIARGHDVEERTPFGDLQAIHIDDNGLMTGASDSRGRGTVAGL
ncbi:MAG: gamma-glutamyltransferase [candidate division Zixibacteria bacterium]|nr:gamma-glutamyltransferase [candidate division Zixibacteria bacterium]